MVNGTFWTRGSSDDISTNNDDDDDDMCQGAVLTPPGTTKTAAIETHRYYDRHAVPPRPRILYGCIFAWLSIVGGRFMAPFLRHEADFQNDTLIGLSFSIGMGITTLLAPWGGSLADQYEFRKPNKGRTQILMAGVLIGSFVFMCHGVQHLGSSAETTTTTTFWKSTIWHFTLRMVFAIAFSMTIPVLDGITLAHLEANNDNKNNDDNNNGGNKASTSYGQERLHGAIWWAITNLALGPCLDRWGFQVLYGFALVSTIACIVCITYYTSGQQQLQLHQPENHGRTINNTCNSKSSYQRNDDKEVSATEKGQTQEYCDKTPLANTSNPNDTTKVPMTTLFRFMWGTLYGCTFLIFLSCLRVGTSVVDQMAFLYFEYLHSTYWMCSITVVLTVLFEIPIFHLAPTLLQKWGPGTLQFVAGIAYVTRVVGYTLVPKGEMGIILLLEPLHGVTYACSKASSVEFASRLMPTGYESSGQGLLGLFEGLGCMTGLFVGGWMEEHLGPRTMYRLLALVVFLGMSIFVIGSVIRKQEQQTPLSSSLSSSLPLSAESRKQKIIPAKRFDNNDEANQSVMNNCSEETAPLMVKKQGNPYI